jgi:ribonuclease G
MAKKLVVLGSKNDVFSFLLEGDEVVKIRLDSKDRKEGCGKHLLGKGKKIGKGHGRCLCRYRFRQRGILTLEGGNVKGWRLAFGSRGEG